MKAFTLVVDAMMSAVVDTLRREQLHDPSGKQQRQRRPVLSPWRTPIEMSSPGTDGWTINNPSDGAHTSAVRALSEDWGPACGL